MIALTFSFFFLFGAGVMYDFEYHGIAIACATISVVCLATAMLNYLDGRNKPKV